MDISEIKKVCFVGGGTIGCWNSLITAMAGYQAVVYDVSEAMLADAPNKHQQQLKGAAKLGLINGEHAEAGLARIHYTSDAQEAAQNADLLSESVPEKLSLKRQVHQQFDALCPEKTLFTTNTSSLLVSEIEDAVQRREKFSALHFHLYGGLIDIVGGPKTHPDVTETLRQFSISLNQTPVIHTAEKDGYLWNSLLILNHKNAIMLVVNGYGTVENVDRSVMAAGYNKIGPFGQLDMVGLDLARDIFQAKFERDGDPEFKRAVEFLDSYVNQGHLGMKSGQGFYQYPKAAWQSPTFLRGE